MGWRDKPPTGDDDKMNGLGAWSRGNRNQARRVKREQVKGDKGQLHRTVFNWLDSWRGQGRHGRPPQ